MLHHGGLATGGAAGGAGLLPLVLPGSPGNPCRLTVGGAALVTCGVVLAVEFIVLPCEPATETSVNGFFAFTTGDTGNAGFCGSGPAVGRDGTPVCVGDVGTVGVLGGAC